LDRALEHTDKGRLIHLMLTILLFIVSSVVISTYMSSAEKKRLNYSILTYSIPGPLLVFHETRYRDLKGILYNDGNLIIDIVYCGENYCLVNIVLSLNKRAKVFSKAFTK